ncbi:Hypothetical predicted protein [Octopus vulgaris]|uniref:Uncharacterized protein n=1 Tax=Octopus vulgaris TaxID=6645 RepID=A0AA36BL55_OCTVU|nr:Hypothetical predicted protein [Octopus vulgaris]
MTLSHYKQSSNVSNSSVCYQLIVMEDEDASVWPGDEDPVEESMMDVAEAEVAMETIVGTALRETNEDGRSTTNNEDEEGDFFSNITQF